MVYHASGRDPSYVSIKQQEGDIVYEYLAKCVQGIADFDPKGFCSRRKLQVSMDVKEHWLKVKLDELISNYGKNFV